MSHRHHLGEALRQHRPRHGDVAGETIDESHRDRSVIREQGFPDPHPDRQLYVALMLQPRLVGVLVVLGIVLQSAWLFLTVSAMLAWSALVPALNPFDAIYNHVVAYRRGLEPLRRRARTSPLCRRSGGHACAGDRSRDARRSDADGVAGPGAVDGRGGGRRLCTSLRRVTAVFRSAAGSRQQAGGRGAIVRQGMIAGH